MKNCKCGAQSSARLFLGLCPVAAAATCGVNGLAIGIVALIVMVVSGLLLAALKKAISENARIPASVLVICLITGVVQILMNRLFPALAAELGIFVPLCAVGAMLCLLPDDAGCPIRCGIASLVMLTLLGVLCELIGSGALFGKTLWQNANARVLIARFPAGAFILLGILAGIYAAITGRGKGDA